MKKINRSGIRASSLVLLAFSFFAYAEAQQLRSLSGANSPNDDTNPVWIGNNTLLFTRAFHSSNLGGSSDPGDVWMTQKNANGSWKEATHRPDLSSKGYDLPLGLQDALTLLVLRSENGKNSVHRYSKFGQEWNYLRQDNLPGLDDFEGPLSGRVTTDGKLIFLSGKRKDGFGNEDLYFTENLNQTDWSELRNLGAVINGFGQEMGPFFDPVTNQLFYSSNSHPGASGKDILISKRMGETWDSWSKPEKWEQISSRGSEASIAFISKDEVVWTSTQNSDGYADLMTFSTVVPLLIPTEFVAPVLPQVKTEEPKILAKATQEVEVKQETVIVPLTDSTNVYLPKPTIVPIENQPLTVELPIFWLVVDSKSKAELIYSITFYKEIELIDYQDIVMISKLTDVGITSVKISAQGYFPKLIPVAMLDSKSRNEVSLTQAQAGSTVLLDNVNFKRGTAELEGTTTEASLSDLAVFLKENPQIKIRINGHTDNAGDPGLNKKLSLDRAGRVRDFLIDQGVNFENLRISGWGGTRPIASNATEEGRAKNRRVELAVEN